MKGFVSFLVFLTLLSCNSEVKKSSKNKTGETKILSDAGIIVRDYVNKDIVIAHRGSLYWSPEETEPAFRWSRNYGTDYLELDVQLTKDSILVAFHDSKLMRTTNITEVFPDRAESGINDFTLKELRNLDAGSWFNAANPERAKNSFENLRILTLEDVVMIAEGYKIKGVNDPEQEIQNGEWTGHYLYEKDPADNGNRPGLYIETKSPKPGTERILAIELAGFGWDINNNAKEIATEKGKVDIANTKARIILQSFSRKSIIQLEQVLPNIPKCLLLWHPNMGDDIKTDLIEAINFGIDNNVHIIGPSIAGEPNNYGELTAQWITELFHSAGMIIHPYTFDTDKQFNNYRERIDGVFTNRIDLALNIYKRQGDISPEDCFVELGYQ